MRPSTRVVLAALAAGGAAFGYGCAVERNQFTLRRHTVPVLPDGASPLRVLHLSDIHLTPGRHRLLAWIRTLDALDPDLVVNTGDSIAHPGAVGPLVDALGPLLERPGLFVYGSNDLYAPAPKNPFAYFAGPSHSERVKTEPDLPWRELGEGMTAGGWLDANNERGSLKAGGLDIQFGGVHDSHINRDRYERIAGPADESADLRVGVMHSPEPDVLDQFAADGYDLLLAGHTHGGQVCVPGFGALVTNCGLDRSRASGLHQHPRFGGPDRAWLHVSAGLGTSPWAPFRFACPPEASLLTLVPRIG